MRIKNNVILFLLSLFVIACLGYFLFSPSSSNATDDASEEANADKPDAAVAIEENESETFAQSGTLNESVSWSISPEGILTISGAGGTGDFKGDAHPWDDYRERILAIEVSNGITEIGKHTFSNCSQAQSVTLPDSVKIIGNHAFSECNNLESISFSENVEEIDATAFDYCSNIKAFSVAEGNKVYCDKKDVLYKRNAETGKLILIHYPPAKPGDTYVVESESEGISVDAFCCCKLKDVTVPDSVKLVNYYAFEKHIGSELTIHFLGDAPTFYGKDDRNNAFTGTKATVYYSAQNKTWAKIAKEQPQYGGTVTWKPE